MDVDRLLYVTVLQKMSSRPHPRTFAKASRRFIETSSRGFVRFVDFPAFP